MIEPMRELVKDKTELFLLYESETQKLVSTQTEDTEGIADAITARDDLIQKINSIDAKAEDIRLRSDAGKRAHEIMKNRCDYSNLSEEERLLFDESQALYTVISRIRELDGLAQERLAKAAVSLKEKIRQNNANTKFTGYLKQMDQGSKGMLYDKKR